MGKDLKEELLKKISVCEDNIAVGEVCQIFLHSIDGLEQETDSVKDVKEKVTKGEYNAFMNAILFTFFSAIYINCDIPREEQNKRIKEFCTAFRDKIKSIAIEDRKYDA